MYFQALLTVLVLIYSCIIEMLQVTSSVMGISDGLNKLVDLKFGIFGEFGWTGILVLVDEPGFGRV